jgi:acyl dehydratase
MTAPKKVAADAITDQMDLDEYVYGPITREDIRRYALASGDDNPIHQDEEYAKASGAPTVFAMGMLPAGYLAHAVSDWFGGPQHLRRFKVRFTTRVWPGDEIVCRGKVTHVDGRNITVSAQAFRRGEGPDGLELEKEQVAITAEADIELPE